VGKSGGEKMATKDFLSATKPLARSRALLLVASVVLAVLVACGVAAVAKLEPAKAAFPGKNGAIAFSSNEGSAGNGFQVWRVNPNGSGKSVLTDFPTDNHNLNPAWSADGKKIAFDSCEPLPPPDDNYCHNDVWVMGANGSDPVKVTSEGHLQVTLEPSWFPTGSKIVYSGGTECITNDACDLYALEFDDSGATVSLTNLSNTPNVSERSPAVSPDGNRIAFTSYRDGDTEIYVMGATGLSAGQPPVMLTNNAVYDTVPVWSPDGQTIAFVRWLPRVDNSPNYEIFAMNADGTGKTNITKTPDASEDAPAYSPNGKRIAFSSNRDGRNGIWKMGANGSHPTQLTAPTTEFYSTGPDWQPLP
jgi:Tol biopolymer transport system component